MVKNRNLLILAAVLVVLLGINVFQKMSHKKNTSRSATEVLIAGTLSAEELGSITIAHGTDTKVVMTPGPTGWIVESAFNSPANQQRIEGLLRSLSDLSGEYRAENADVLADFGLDETSALTVRGFTTGGDVAFAISIGGKPEGANGNFVRKPDSNRVYLTEANLLSALGLYQGTGEPQSTHFVDLHCVKEDRLAVDRIILNDGGSIVEMAKEFAMTEVAPDDTTGAVPEIDRATWEWKLVQPRAAALAKTKADGVMGALISIRAVDVDDPGLVPADYGLADVFRTATMVFEDGSQKTIEFGASRPAEGDKQAGTWIRISGERSIWVVTDYTVTNIFKTVEDLLPE
jgi:hypothetical protein